LALRPYGPVDLDWSLCLQVSPYGLGASKRDVAIFFDRD